jgi:hypothetical protein
MRRLLLDKGILAQCLSAADIDKPATDISIKPESLD